MAKVYFICNIIIHYFNFSFLMKLSKELKHSKKCIKNIKKVNVKHKKMATKQKQAEFNK
jgi:hypothetical protein